MPSLCSCSSSFRLPRENPPPFVKGDPTKSIADESHVRAKGLKRGSEETVEGKGKRESSLGGGGPREPRGRRCTHSSRYIMDTTENPPKEKYVTNKGHPLPPPSLARRPSYLSLVLLSLLACTSTFNASLSLPPPFLFLYFTNEI